MSGSAHIQSVEAIERFRAALALFEKRMEGALDTLSAELGRANDWLAQDCPHYWKEQEKLAADAVHQARLDLERCLAFPIAGEKPACREERAALKAAKNRWSHCHEKQAVVKHWTGVMNHEMFEYQGRVGHLRRILETELPAARAKLQLIVRQIEGYQTERPPDLEQQRQDIQAADFARYNNTGEGPQNTP